MTPAQTHAPCRPDPEAAGELAAGHGRLHLSGRGHQRVMRLARTVADLRGHERVTSDDVSSALMLRRRSEDR
jgi:magnesium chelatase family protein